MHLLAAAPLAAPRRGAALAAPCTALLPRTRNKLTLLFSSNLGIDDTYFALESVETIADHIMALFGAKILAYTKHSSSLDIDLEHTTDNGAVFIHSSKAGESQTGGPQWERR